MVTTIEDFQNFVHQACMPATELGKINNLIFHNWSEEEGRKKLPAEIVDFISRNIENETVKDAIYHCLLPQDLRSE